MTNADVAKTFDEIADLLELQGANAFRVRAYRNAAKTIGDLHEPITEILVDSTRSLTDLPGIGDDLAKKIAALIADGTFPQLQELRQAIPASVLSLARVPGVGPKKAAALFNELKITNLDELRAACERHDVQQLKGFGAKTEATILAGLDLAATAEKRMLWADADELVAAIRTHLSAVPGLEKLESAGSYRRGKDTVGDLDFLAVTQEPAAVMDRLAAFAGVAQVIARGDTKMSVRLAAGTQVDLRVVPEESFGAAWQYFTGSKEHNVVVRGRAKDRGLKLNEYGLFRGEEYVAGRTEEEVYRAVGLAWCPPELRENRREFEWAERGEFPPLIVAEDIVPDLHMHTDATDGRDTLEQMIAAARARGLQYIAITDHSQRVSMANGLTPDRALRQWEAIDRINEKLQDFVVLKGIEVDILEKGGLDLPDDVLARADWVMASIHYGQNQPREQITDRILEAIQHPSVTAISHPTGRLLNRRKPYDVDLDAVFDAALEHGKFLELNANPYRLDLDDAACAAAKERGIPIVISTDAHSTDDFDKLRYGIVQARRAGLTKADVVNTRSWSEVRKMIGRRRSS